MRKLPLSVALLSASPLLAATALAETGVADSNRSVNAGAAFNPQISLILDGNFYKDNQDGEGAEVLEEAAGILHGEHFHEHEHGMGNGFNLGESELVMSASVDAYFDARFTATFSGHGDVEVEEAWLHTRSLPAGLRVKAGKFLSEIGYQNSQHPHSWDFSDQNLAYLGILGDHGLMDTGLQLTWLAPTPFYLLLGAEALQGNDQERFGTLVDAEDADGVVTSGAGLGEAKDGPRLSTAFVKFGPDLGDDHALQLGLSWARAKQFQQVIAETTGEEYALEGDQTLYGLDAVYKFDGRGEAGQGDFKAVAEYLSLDKDMQVTGAEAASPLGVGSLVSGKQDGYYLQASYGFLPRWKIGARYDVSGATNELNEAGTLLEFGKSTRSTLALSFYPSEFSRLRLQASSGEISAEDGSSTDLRQVMLSYNLSLGTHGAHKF
jgi:hypothetical protein